MSSRSARQVTIYCWSTNHPPMSGGQSQSITQTGKARQRQRRRLPLRTSPRPASRRTRPARNRAEHPDRHAPTRRAALGPAAHTGGTVRRFSTQVSSRCVSPGAGFPWNRGDFRNADLVLARGLPCPMRAPERRGCPGGGPPWAVRPAEERPGRARALAHPGGRRSGHVRPPGSSHG